jgi:hypothetical protein
MKKLAFSIVLTLSSFLLFAQVKQCNEKNCRMFHITKTSNKITFTNISNKLVWVAGFCETTDGKWETNYQSFEPVFPKSQEDIANLQYSCQCIHPSKKKTLTGNFVIFYYNSGENCDLSMNQLKEMCKK